MDAVRAAVEERDLLLLLADAARPIGKDDRQALDLARKCHAPVVLVLNKIDLVKDRRCCSADRPVSRRLRVRRLCSGFGHQGQGLDELKKVILHHLPEGPEYFPEDHVTDQPERFWPPN